MNWIKCLALAVLPVALSAALSACGGGANDAPATPADFASAVSAQRAPQAPAAANVFELADVLAYIRINNLYIPTQIYQAAQVAGLDATQLDGLYGLSPGTAAAFITGQGWAALAGGATVVGLGAAQPAAISAGTLSYGRTATFTLTGSNLSPSNLSVSVDKCTGLALAAGGTGSTRTLTCRVSGTGALTVQARTPAGGVLLSSTFTVPQPQVTLATSQGTMVLELNPTQAPVTVNNFLAYTGDGFYAGTLFHRVIAGFVIQAGGVTSGLVVKPVTYAPIVLESNNGLSNLRGTVAMARTNDLNSATSQFFINHVDNPGLNYSTTSAGYAVFGSVVTGMDVVDRIAALPTRTVGAYQNVPQTEVTILSAQQTR